MQKKLREAIDEFQASSHQVGDHIGFNREAVRAYNKVIPFSADGGTIKGITGNGLKVETDDSYEILVYFNDVDNKTNNRYEGEVK